MSFSNQDTSENIVTRENILSRLSEYDIYNHYMPGIKIGHIYKSPLRKDKNPSFGIFIGRSGDLAFNDYRIGGGDCFHFVALMEGYDYYNAMCYVNHIFGLGLTPLKPPCFDPKSAPIVLKVSEPGSIKKHKRKISVQLRKWQKHDIEYWKPITKVIQVKPIEFFWIDEQMFGADKYAYAYRYGENIYKIYQPFKDPKGGKWFSNIDHTVPWFGHERLPRQKDDSTDYLFVCSSNKDALVLINAGFHAIAPHSESQIFSQAQYDYYTSIFDKVIIFYDNDEAGEEYSLKFSRTWGLDYILLDDVETKDPFEFVKKYGISELTVYILDTIELLK